MVDFSTKTNERRLKRAAFEGVLNGLEDLAERICELAVMNTAKFTNTGTLARGISSQANQGASLKMDDGSRIEVPINVPEVDKKNESAYIEYGSYVPYAATVEFGSKPHVIEPDPSRTEINGKPRTNPHLRWESGGKAIYAKKVNHPGTSPQPYMRPAVDKVRNEDGLRILGNAVVKALVKAGLVKFD